jgi:hypothetical protein
VRRGGEEGERKERSDAMDGNWLTGVNSTGISTAKGYTVIAGKEHITDDYDSRL